MKTDLCIGKSFSFTVTMNFTHEMIARLSAQDKLVLHALFEKAREIPSSMEKVPEWQWTLKGPATEQQALRARKVGLSPRLTGGTVSAAALIDAALASSGGHASQASLPVLHLSTPTE
jgi:hypothetical protein